VGAGWASDVCDAFWALELCAMPFGVRVEPPKLKRLRKLDIGCLRWTRRDQQQLKACSRNGLRSRRVKVESEVQSVRCSGQTGEPGKRAKKIRPFPTLVEPQQTPHIRKRATSRVTNSSAHVVTTWRNHLAELTTCGLRSGLPAAAYWICAQPITELINYAVRQLRSRLCDATARAFARYDEFIFVVCRW